MSKHAWSNIDLWRKNTDGEQPLIAACLTDLITDGLSMVYSFYEPTEQQRSFGTYMILDHIERARRLGLPHVYLGYWVDGSRKMAIRRASCRRSGSA